ncbi:MAG: L-threonylcarbamoyladenylate synthase [Pseudobdellovibrionaceae bacterium]
MTNSQLDQAIEKLKQGDVVAIPTETVYGLAARIDSKAGIQKIFSTKQRPFFDPLIVHVSSKDMAAKLTTDWSPLADFLAEHFWPGPLTLILPKADAVDSMITSGLSSVGIRMPKHSLALSLIEKSGVPLAAPSANRFGRTSPTTADHVKSEFPNEGLLVLDGGPCEVGLESTVLLIRRFDERYELSILRSGKVTQGELEKTLQNQKFQISFVAITDKKESPGQMKHHYMPEIPLVYVKNPALTETQVREKVKQMLFKLPDQVEGVQIRKPKNLDRAGELKLPDQAVLASRQFYAELRRMAESQNYDFLYFRRQALHDKEDWNALKDRLTKAASLILEGRT